GAQSWLTKTAVEISGTDLPKRLFAPSLFSFCSKTEPCASSLWASRTMIKSAEFLFVVKRRDDDTPWIALQPKVKGLEDIAGEIGLDLYRGTSLEEAKQLARFLNSNIKAVNYACADKRS